MSLRTKAKRKKLKKQKKRRHSFRIEMVTPAALKLLQKIDGRKIDYPSELEERAMVLSVLFYASPGVCLDLLSAKEQREFKNLAMWTHMRQTDGLSAVKK